MMGEWGSVDFRELKTFQKKLDKLAQQEYDKFCKDCAKELAACLLAKVIPRTPVGDHVYYNEDVVDVDGNAVTYKRGEKKGQIKQKRKVAKMGGTLRRGWTAKTEEEAENGSGKKNLTQSEAKEYVESLPIKQSGDKYEIEIINPVHYASYVEYGHRQTPGCFVPAIGKRLTKGWAPGKLMLTKSEIELNAQTPQILNAMLEKFLREVFDGK